MTNKISYETIYQCKMGSEQALTEILNHYEPLIVKASIRTVNLADSSKQRIIDQDIKAYIQSELAMKIITNTICPINPAINVHHKPEAHPA